MVGSFEVMSAKITCAAGSSFLQQGFCLIGVLTLSKEELTYLMNSYEAVASLFWTWNCLYQGIFDNTWGTFRLPDGLVMFWKPPS